MARIAGLDLNNTKRIDIALTALYGIGRKNVVNVLTEAKVVASKRVADLSAEEINSIQKLIDRIMVEGALRQKVSDDVKRLKIISAYRGVRHHQGLPVRGQRTRSNARTKRGRRKTVGALKKEDAAKLAPATETK